MNQTVLEKIKIAQEGTFPVCIWGAGYVGRNYGYQLVRELGIKVDFYCDNNKSLYGQEIRDGIRCVAIENIPANTLFFIMVAGHLVYEITDQLKTMGFERFIRYMDLCEIKAENYFEVQRRKQIAIYTCISGDYDEVLIPNHIADECDYYVISDKKEKEDSFFTYFDLSQYVPCDIVDNARKNRFCKINAHKLFPQYRYSIYFDGNIEIKKEIVKYIKTLPKTRITTLFRAGYDSVYAEAFRCLKHKRDSEERITKQMEKYWLEGMPDDFGLVGPGIMIREHNNPICKKIMEDWWEEVDHFSKRDMISLSYVLWKNGYTIEDVNTLTKERDYFDGDAWVFNRNHKKVRTDN